MTVQEQLTVIKSNVVDLLPEDEVVKKLERSVSTGKPLTIKLGLDPSRPDIHIGHAVVLNKLRQFQDLGHNVVLIIGDFTAMIGDPTGKSKTRPALTLEETRENGKTYINQASIVLDMDKTKVVYNSEWLDKLSFKEVIALAAKYTVAQLLERDDFTKRYRGGEPISVHEFLYPLSQAYDSVAIKSDIELGGTDQKFNLLVGREVMRAYELAPQCILTMPILEGTDGVEKMSKSLDNYIALTDSPRDMFGKTMSIPDTLTTRYLQYAAYATPAEVADLSKGLADGSMHPRTAKVDVAKRIVARYHGQQAADDAFAEFERVHVKKERPRDVKTYRIRRSEVVGSEFLSDQMKVSLRNSKFQEFPLTVFLVVYRIADSMSAAKRLISQGGVYLDGERVTDIGHVFNPNVAHDLKVGKLHFSRIERYGDED